MSSDDLVSIVCPFYNERDSLRELLLRLLRTSLQLGRPMEIVLVDDGSTDGGSDVVHSVQENAVVTLVQLDRHRGKTAALWAGFEKARGAFLVTLDSDLQDPPEEIPTLLEELEHCDLVVGIRTNRQDSAWKRFQSSISNRFRRLVLRDHIVDIGCGLQAFRRTTLSSFPHVEGMHRFFCAIAELDGFRVCQVQVAHHSRKWGRSKFNLINRGLGPLFDLANVWWYRKRRLLQTKEESHD